MVVGVAGSSLTFIDVGSGKVVSSVREAHGDRIADVEVVVGGGGETMVATGGKDGKVRLWKVPILSN